ncbi:MAG: DUF4153 domain-containing protein [Eubacteriales bacterium]|nr:DUF4153 domain-containing protein [Eubacteriales bacterium]
MKFVNFLLGLLEGLLKAVTRYWAVFICLTAMATLNIISIETDANYERSIIALAFGVFCFLAAQSLTERFSEKFIPHLAVYSAAFLAFAGYFTYVKTLESIDNIVGIKTVTLMFALLVTFIWIPSYKNKADFGGVFLCVFKASFTSAFFCGVIFGGISLILAAADALLFNISSKAFLHTANIVWVLLAPMLLLSLIPVFAGKNRDADGDNIKKAQSYPKFLETLLSYVLIPLISIYTLVLIVYTGKTIISSSWDDNLLEPIILSYLIAMLILYLLVYRLDNAFSRAFVKIAPLILAVIALFQLSASVIAFIDGGMVVSRYYIIMFCIYAIICGVLLFMRSKKRKDYIAYLAVIFALVCVIPYVGAFGASAISQSNRVENTLIKNGMLEDGKIIKKSDIPTEDMEKIEDGIYYLYQIKALDRLDFLPVSFDPYNGFYNVFGFDSNDIKYNYITKSFELDSGTPVATEGYKYLYDTAFYLTGKNVNNELFAFTADNADYKIKLIEADNAYYFIFLKDNAEIITVPIKDVIDLMSGYPEGTTVLKQDKLAFDYENESIYIRLVYKSVRMNVFDNDTELYANVYILFTLR